MSASHLTQELAPSSSNLETLAREARFHLLGLACRRHGIADLLIGHHADDDYEHILMRKFMMSATISLGMKSYARLPYPVKSAAQYGVHNSGSPRDFAAFDSLKVSNVCGFESGGVVLHRPFRRVGKAELVQLLKDNDIPWVEDPSNNNVSLTMRNTIRSLNQLHIPKALRTQSMLETVDEASEIRFKYERLAKKLLHSCRLKFDPCLGVLYAHLPIWSSIEKSCDDAKLSFPRLVAAYLIRYLTDCVSPNVTTSLSSIFPLIKNVFPECPDGLANDQWSAEGVQLKLIRIKPGVWPASAAERRIELNASEYLAFAPNPADSRSTAFAEHFIIPATIADGTSSQESPFHFFDNRFWISVRNPTPFPVSLHFLTKENLEALERQVLAGEVRLESQALSKDTGNSRKQSSGLSSESEFKDMFQKLGAKKNLILRSRLPVLVSSSFQTDSGPQDLPDAERILAFPTLGVRVLPVSLKDTNDILTCSEDITWRVRYKWHNIRQLHKQSNLILPVTELARYAWNTVLSAQTARLSSRLEPLLQHLQTRSDQDVLRKTSIETTTSLDLSRKDHDDPTISAHYSASHTSSALVSAPSELILNRSLAATEILSQTTEEYMIPQQSLRLKEFSWYTSKDVARLVFLTSKQAATVSWAQYSLSRIQNTIKYNNDSRIDTMSLLFDRTMFRVAKSISSLRYAQLKRNSSSPYKAMALLITGQAILRDTYAHRLNLARFRVEEIQRSFMNVISKPETSYRHKIASHTVQIHNFQVYKAFRSTTRLKRTWWDLQDSINWRFISENEIPATLMSVSNQWPAEPGLDSSWSDLSDDSGQMWSRNHLAPIENHDQEIGNLDGVQLISWCEGTDNLRPWFAGPRIIDVTIGDPAYSAHYPLPGAPGLKTQDELLKYVATQLSRRIRAGSEESVGVEDLLSEGKEEPNERPWTRSQGDHSYNGPGSRLQRSRRLALKNIPLGVEGSRTSGQPPITRAHDPQNDELVALLRSVAKKPRVTRVKKSWDTDQHELELPVSGYIETDDAESEPDAGRTASNYKKADIELPASDHSKSWRRREGFSTLRLPLSLAATESAPQTSHTRKLAADISSSKESLAEATLASEESLFQLDELEAILKAAEADMPAFAPGPTAGHGESDIGSLNKKKNLQ